FRFMSDAVVLAARQIHTAIEACGTSAVLDGSTVLLPSLNSKVRIAEVNIKDHGVAVVYDFSARDVDAEGVKILVVGIGADSVKALGEAAFQWTTGVFMTLRHWLTPSAHTCFVEDLHMLVRTTEPINEFAWRVHVGPILSRAFGVEEDQVDIP